MRKCDVISVCGNPSKIEEGVTITLGVCRDKLLIDLPEKEIASYHMTSDEAKWLIERLKVYVAE